MTVLSTLMNERLAEAVARAALPQKVGRLERIVGMHAEVSGLDAGTGDLILIGDHLMVPAEVIGVSDNRLTALPLGSLQGLRSGERVRSTTRQMSAPSGRQLLGRVLDGNGSPIDGGPELTLDHRRPLHAEAPAPLQRPLVTKQLQTGVRAIDGLLPLGRGQRIGIMAGSGVGKSSLLSMLLRGTDADVTVLALIGERGREVKEFIEHDLGPDGLERAVVIAATSDQPALVRRNAALLATSVAESFRDDGADVLLLMDSVTRFAMAQREIGLAAGEVPTSRGYPPSVFALLPQLMERSGTSAAGSITGVYTVLVEGDDMNDPIGDTTRSILDGHIVLTRDLANAGHFPSIDILQSASRLAGKITSREQQQAATATRRMVAVLDDAKDLIELGMYAAGSDPTIDDALRRSSAITEFVQQDFDQLSDLQTTAASLARVVAGPVPPEGQES
jgi:flagellum-specific ATP synthase